MDVAINSQIQSPLVRALARTKGKSQSFVHNIPDNVPPCSFAKIELTAQNQADSTYSRQYKLKIPQYGFLRDLFLRYTVQESPIDPSIVAVAQNLYNNPKQWFLLDDIQAIGTRNFSNDSRNQNISWYNMQAFGEVLFEENQSTPYGQPNQLLDPTYMTYQEILSPQFTYLYAMPVTPPGQTYANCVNQNAPGQNQMQIGFISPTGAPLAVKVNARSQFFVQYDGGLPSDTLPANLTQNIGAGFNAIQINGSAALWGNMMKLYWNIYKLASTPSTGTATPPTGPGSVAALVWNKFQSLPRETVSVPISTTAGYGGATPSYAQGHAYTPVAGDQQSTTSVVLPAYIETVNKAGTTFWIPKLPQLVFDNNGNVTDVRFVAMHFMHPLDNADKWTDTFLANLSTVSTTSASQNFRQFAFDPKGNGQNQFQPWDWQTESYYYPGFSANIAERVILSTHNRPIQTIFPQETLLRTHRTPTEDRTRYLSMMKPKVTVQGRGKAYGLQAQPGQKTIYFPLFLSSTENPSLNFDTRFVEQLDLDVYTNPMTTLYHQADVTRLCNITGGVPLIETFVGMMSSNVWSFDYIAPASTSAQTALTATLSQWTLATSQILSDMSVIGFANANTATSASAAASYLSYLQNSPGMYCLWMRSYTPVPANYIRVEALAMYHNFHDATAKAIRDSNYKPGEPSNLLMYNTYYEQPIQVTANNIRNGDALIVPLATNNLIFGISFMIRRYFGDATKSRQALDHYMQTLPVRQVVLTGSGQQLYNAKFDECALTDVWDYDLATASKGRKYDNGVMIQSRISDASGDVFYFYYIPLSFSSNMTYNSGSMAMQTINNPQLVISLDTGALATSPFNVLARDNEWQIQVWENYWNMIRIDSSTGAITKSLDI